MSSTSTPTPPTSTTNVPGKPNPDNYILAGQPTTAEAATNFAEAMKGVSQYMDDPLSTYVCFVSPAGSRKRICRHIITAADRTNAARNAAQTCTLAKDFYDLEVEVFVHAGILYQYELVEQEGKK